MELDFRMGVKQQNSWVLLERVVRVHCVYARQGEALHLNFQDRDGYLLSYQVKQLIKMMDKYGDL